MIELSDKDEPGDVLDLGDGTFLVTGEQWHACTIEDANAGRFTKGHSCDECDRPPGRGVLEVTGIGPNVVVIERGVA